MGNQAVVCRLSIDRKDEEALDYPVRTVEQGSKEVPVCIGKEGINRIKILPTNLTKGRRSSKTSIEVCIVGRTQQIGPISEIT